MSGRVASYFKSKKMDFNIRVRINRELPAHPIAAFQLPRETVWSGQDGQELTVNPVKLDGRRVKPRK
jgi:hypothetical protein